MPHDSLKSESIASVPNEGEGKGMQKERACVPGRAGAGSSMRVAVMAYCRFEAARSEVAAPG